MYRTPNIQLVPDDAAGEGKTKEKICYGPHRVQPGRLSVSRTIGDIEAKLTKYGGKDGVIIA